MSEEGKGEIQLTAEDYLQGVIGMVNELVSRIPSDFVPYVLTCSPDYPRTRSRLKTSNCQPVSRDSSMTSSPRIPSYVLPFPGES